MNSLGNLLYDVSIPSYIPPNKPLFAFVAEAPGQDEVRNHLAQLNEGKVGWPLFGTAGRQFTKLTSMAGIDRWECYVGNILPFKLDGNKIKSICQPKDTVYNQISHVRKGGYPGFPLPPWALSPLLHVVAKPIEAGAYLPQQCWPSLVRLWRELRELEWTSSKGIPLPIIIPMGGSALWAVCGKTGIDKARGAICNSAFMRSSNTPFWCFPTNHPQATIYDAKKAPIMASDLKKVQVVADGGGDVQEVVAWVPQTPSELRSLIHTHLTDVISIDIETPRKERSKLIDLYEDEDDTKIDVEKWPPIASRLDRYIKMIGFNSDGRNSIVVPFFCEYKPNGCWWDTTADQHVVMRYLHHILQAPNIKKVFQNGSFDVQYIQEIWRIPVANYAHDTRLLHHALYPAMPKDLHTLASIYLNLPAWKHAVTHTMGKRDD